MKDNFIEIPNEIIQEYAITKWIKEKKGWKRKIANVRVTYKLTNAKQLD